MNFKPSILQTWKLQHGMGRPRYEDKAPSYLATFSHGVRGEEFLVDPLQPEDAVARIRHGYNDYERSMPLRIADGLHAFMRAAGLTAVCPDPVAPSDRIWHQTGIAKPAERAPF